MDYGTRYTHEYGSDNGVLWRLSFDVAGYTGASQALDDFAPDGHVTVRAAVASPSGDAGALSAVAPVTLRARLLPLPADHRDGPVDLFSLRALPDRHVRVRLDADLGGDPDAATYPVRYFSGFLLPERIADVPGDPLGTVEVTASGQLHLAVDLPAVDTAAEGYDPDDVRTLVDWARGILNPLAEGETGRLVTRVDWRPYLGGNAPTADDDPVAALRLRSGAFADADGVVTAQDAALRAIAGRLLARLFQAPSADGAVEWHLAQRGYLARTAGVDVATFTYDLADDDADAAPGTKTTPDVVRDTIAHERGLYGASVSADTGRAGGMSVRTVQSDYDFRPDLDNAIFNGSFEQTQVTGLGTQPLYWTGSGLISLIGPGQASTTNQRRLSLIDPTWDGSGTEPDRIYAEQDGLAFVPGSARFSLELSFVVIDGSYDPSATSVTPMQWRLAVGAHPMRSATVTVIDDALRGTSARVSVEPLLAGVSDAVDGTPCLPSGAVLYFGDPALDATPALRLSEPAAVGDIVLTGDLSDSLSAADEATIWYFADAEADVTPDVHNIALPDLGDPVNRRYATDVRAAAMLITPSGAPVSGYLRTAVYGSLTIDGAPGGGAPDLFVARIASRDRDASTFGARVMLPAGSGRSLSAALPVTDPGQGHRIGDGPLPTTETRLLCAGASGAVSDITGHWAQGVPTEATGVSVDELAAREALSQLAGREAEGGGPEAWTGTLRLPHAGAAPDETDALWWPQDVYRLWQPAVLMLPATAGAGEVVLSSAPKPGQPVVLDFDGGAAEETHHAGEVLPGPLGYVVTLTDAAGDPATLAADHAAHAPCLVSMAAWWNAYDYDTTTGAVALDAADLAWRDDADFLTEITLSAD